MTNAGGGLVIKKRRNFEVKRVKSLIKLIGGLIKSIIEVRNVARKRVWN